jgi:hypothetical protein
LLLLLLLLLDSSIDRSRSEWRVTRSRSSSFCNHRIGKEMKLRLTSTNQSQGSRNRSIPPFCSPSVTKETTGTHSHTHTKMDRSILYISISKRT